MVIRRNWAGHSRAGEDGPPRFAAANSGIDLGNAKFGLHGATTKCARESRIRRPLAAAAGKRSCGDHACGVEG